jgi:hypothetical protein
LLLGEPEISHGRRLEDHILNILLHVFKIIAIKNVPITGQYPESTSSVSPTIV